MAQKVIGGKLYSTDPAKADKLFTSKKTDYYKTKNGNYFSVADSQISQMEKGKVLAALKDAADLTDDKKDEILEGYFPDEIEDA